MGNMASATVDRSGRIMLPVEVRRKLKIGEGDVLSVSVEDGRIMLMSQREALRRAQAFFRSVDPDGIWSEELSQDRQREVKAELED
jgi:AbrB family looped-hinge helix DNA binding protein